ncbi:GNAT family N-acetyltransferase [Nocardioides sp. AX2bis]|uniref:GNAT family N-acetyltransferase n=1 Tax=Nocardioides sp. AX2bis TaxID=2653157 RepID=UPI0012F12B49|nr:GNAT family N-acetyltransferase [Nocardioides sp. AX2bis]VXB01110.1 Ribosomal-protein-S18p-alanine acetyltransferase [Nocardioides sp. AX2bis]
MTARSSPPADAARVRRATARDAAAVAALEEAGLGDDAWSYGLLSEVVGGTLPTVHALVAEADGEVLGYAAGSLVVDVAELQRLVVAGPARRRGIARALLDALLGLARDAGAERVLLEVRADNEGARAFYAAAGFAEVGTRPRYYRDGESALVLERSVPAR